MRTLFVGFLLTALSLGFAAGASAQGGQSSRRFETGFVKIALKEGQAQVTIGGTSRVRVTVGAGRSTVRARIRTIEGMRVLVITGSLTDRRGKRGVVTVEVPHGTSVEFSADPATVLQTSITDSRFSDPTPGGRATYSFIRQPTAARFTRLTKAAPHKGAVAAR